MKRDAPVSVRAAPDDVVADRFVLHERRGSGASATVWRATDRRDGATVALKIYRGHADIDRFAREANILAGLSHPGIVRYVSHGVTRGDESDVPYLAMEWLEGETLRDRLVRHRLDVDEASSVVRQLASALAEAHERGVVHRDIKPANVVLVGDSIERVKVLDFGIARLAERGLTLTGTTLGTPGYMAPEQVRGEPDVDARADVFALGCVLFRALTGRLPVEGDDVVTVLLRVVLADAPRLRELVPTVPAGLDDLCARMLSRHRDRRPANAGALASALAGLATDATVGLPAAPAAGGEPLTGAERHGLSLVLAHTQPDTLDDHADEDGRTEVLRDRRADRPGDRASTWLDGARRAVDALGERLVQLSDGTLLVAVTPAGEATDRAARAARCGLAIRSAVPGAAVAVVSGFGETRGQLLVGELIAHGVTVLRGTDVDHVALDEPSASLLDARFAVERRGGTLHLLREHDDSSHVRTVLGRPTPCVGRDRELDLLAGLVDDCVREARATAALVLGAPGIGKSRLRHELLRRVRGHADLDVWIARGDPMKQRTPLGLLAGAVRHAAGIQEGAPASLSRRRLATRVRGRAGTTDRVLVDFLCELTGVRGVDGDSPEVVAARSDPMSMQARLRRAFVDLLSRALAVHPTILVVEDAQFADAQSLEAIDVAVRELSDRPLFVLALGRPEVEERGPLFGDAMRLRLGGLPRRSAVELVAAVLGCDPTAPATSELVERAGGNPFYLEELIRSAGERASSLPESVLAMTAARLGRLAPGARRVLRAASVFGETFWQSGVAALLPASERGAPFDGWLDALVASETVTVRREARFPGERELAFRHALVRDAAYAMLTESDRARGHALAGRWLESVGETDADVLAEHSRLGGEGVRAAVWLGRAARQALGRSDLDGAVRRAEQAVACGAAGVTLGEMRLVQAEAARFKGHKTDSLRSANEALDLLLPGTASWYDAIIEAAVAAGGLGDGDRVEEVARLALSATPQPSARAAWLMALARVTIPLYHSARVELGDAVLATIDAAATLAEADRGRTADFDPTATVAMVRAQKARRHGGLDEFCFHARASADAFERSGVLRMACVMRGGLGHGLVSLGDYDQAERELRAGLAMVERIGLDNGVAEFKHNLGLVLALRGALDEAERVEREAAETYRRAGSLRMEAACHIYLARFALFRGTPERAEVEARRAVELGGRAGGVRIVALASFAETMVATGRPDEARDAAAEVLGALEADAAVVEEGAAYCWLVVARVALALDDAANARAILAKGTDHVLAAAAAIADERSRRVFLEEERDNRDLLALARLQPCG